MAYSVSFTPSADREVRGLRRSLSDADLRHFHAALSQLVKNPYPQAGGGGLRSVGVTKLDKGEWRIRIGRHYRMRYRIEDNRVIITRFAHRKDVYRDL